MYPTLGGRSSTSSSSHGNSEGSRSGSRTGNLPSSQEKLDKGLEGSRDSGFSSTNNMYNIVSRRTSRYESNQDLVSPADPAKDPLDSVFENKLTLQARHGSLENAAGQNSYGSLERHVKKRPVYERKHSDTDTASEASTVTSAKFGKRTSRSEYDLSSKGRENSTSSASSSKETDFPLASRTNFYYGNNSQQYSSNKTDRYNTDRRTDSAASGRMIELPVRHETAQPSDRTPNPDSNSMSDWRSASTEPSPTVQIPTKRLFPPESYCGSGGGGGSGDPQQGQCYSPRGYEGQRGHSQPTKSQSEYSINVRYGESPHGLPQPISSKIVKMSPHNEVSKPFEMKDFYKYSEKLRRQRLVEQYHQVLVGSRANSPTQMLDDHSSTHSSNYRYPINPAYRGQPVPGQGSQGSGSSSPFNSPLSSRHMVSSYPYPPAQDIPINNAQSPTISSVVTTSSTTTNSYGISTTTSRVQYTVQSRSGQVLYKAHHQSSKQTHYQAPASLKCEPVRSRDRDTTSRGSHEAPASTGGQR